MELSEGGARGEVGWGTCREKEAGFGSGGVEEGCDWVRLRGAGLMSTGCMGWWGPGFQKGLGARSGRDPQLQSSPFFPGPPALLRLSRNRGYQHQAGPTLWPRRGAPPGHHHQDRQPDPGGCWTPFPSCLTRGQGCGTVTLGPQRALTRILTGGRVPGAARSVVLRGARGWLLPADH